MNIAIVESPLQLLCAFEMLEEIGGKYRVILRCNGVEKNESSMGNMATVLNIDYQKIIIRKERILFDLILFSFKYFNIILRSYENVFLGDYRSGVIRLFSKLIRSSNKYFLDDGVATFLAQKEMEKKNDVRSIATFFNVSPLRNQKIFYHNFSNLKKIKAEKWQEEGCMVLGQPLVEKNMVPFDDYLKIIYSALKETNGGVNYYPHRSESEDMISYISSIDGVKIVNPNVCIELFLVRSKKIPKVIYSGPSSAVFSLNKIFPWIRIKVFINKSLDVSKIPHLGEIIRKMELLDNVVLKEI